MPFRDPDDYSKVSIQEFTDVSDSAVRVVLTHGFSHSDRWIPRSVIRGGASVEEDFDDGDAIEIQDWYLEQEGIEPDEE